MGKGMFRFADEYNYMPEPNIEAGFFSNGDLELHEGFDAPENTDAQVNMDTGMSLPKKGRPGANNSKSHKLDIATNWRSCINRALMSGLSANDILNSVGERIMALPNSTEIMEYLGKYEGLMGTVFIDAGILDQGFSLDRIPQRYRPFHRFAVNCGKKRRYVSRSFSGGKGGDIDAFLNSVDEAVEDRNEVCALTGLPIYKTGMFTRKLIVELLALLGAKEGGIEELRQLLREKVLGIGKKPVTNLPVAPSMSKALGLTEPELTVHVAKAGKNSKVKVNYKTSKKQDVNVIKAQRQALNNPNLNLKETAPELTIAKSSRQALENPNLHLREESPRLKIGKQGSTPRVKLGYSASHKADVELEDTYNRNPDQASFDLEEPTLTAKTVVDPTSVDVTLGYAPSQDCDVRIEKQTTPEVKNIKLDGELRF